MADTGPNLGLVSGFGHGANGWDVDMDANLGLLDALVNVAVVNVTTTAPPANPREGDRYVVGTPATGAWAGKENTLTVFRKGAFVFYIPKVGTRIFDQGTTMFYYYGATGWVQEPAGESSDGGSGDGSTGIPEAPDDGEMYARKSKAWTPFVAGSGGGSGGGESGVTGHPQFTVPLAADFPAVFPAQPQAVVTDDPDLGLVFSTPCVAGDVPVGVLKNLPTGAGWKVTARLRQNIHFEVYNALGLMLWDEAGQRAQIFGYESTTDNVFQHRIGSIIVPSGYNGNYWTNRNCVGAFDYYQIELAGGKFYCRLSRDGKNFITVSTQSLGDTQMLNNPTKVGIGGSLNIASSENIAVSCADWKQNWQ